MASKTASTAIAKREPDTLNLEHLALGCDRIGCDATYPFRDTFHETIAAATGAGWDKGDDDHLLLCPAEDWENDEPAKRVLPWLPLWDGISRPPGADVAVLAVFDARRVVEAQAAAEAPAEPVPPQQQEGSLAETVAHLRQCAEAGDQPDPSAEALKADFWGQRYARQAEDAQPEGSNEPTGFITRVMERFGGPR